MKPLLLASLTLAAATAVIAAEDSKLDPKVERAVRESVTQCEGLTLTPSPISFRLPARFTGSILRIESPSHACDGQVAAISSPNGGIFIGPPWPLSGTEGATLEEKLKNFAWQNMQQNVAPVIDRSARTIDGLYKVTLVNTTAAGKVPLSGEIDADGTVFFFGSFRRLNGDVKADRIKAFEPFVKTSPARGASTPAVTIVEFSDFECPSCQRSSGFVDPILAKHGEKVRYVRYDLPLSGHPWAFPAAMAGRAVYRQKPELFWAYKKEVYANQDKLSAFTFDDFARGFAQTHQLDLARYDADLASEALKNEILNGVGAAFSNDVRSTPSYLVNGTFVEAGEGGKRLAEYVEGLLK